MFCSTSHAAFSSITTVNNKTYWITLFLWALCVSFHSFICPLFVPLSLHLSIHRLSLSVGKSALFLTFFFLPLLLCPVLSLLPRVVCLRGWSHSPITLVTVTFWLRSRTLLGSLDNSERKQQTASFPLRPKTVYILFMSHRFLINIIFLFWSHVISWHSLPTHSALVFTLYSTVCHCCSLSVKNISAVLKILLLCCNLLSVLDLECKHVGLIAVGL